MTLRKEHGNQRLEGTQIALEAVLSSLLGAVCSVVHFEREKKKITLVVTDFNAGIQTVSLQDASSSSAQHRTDAYLRQQKMVTTISRPRNEIRAYGM